jgi:hypothetical protein
VLVCPLLRPRDPVAFLFQKANPGTVKMRSKAKQGESAMAGSGDWWYRGESGSHRTLGRLQLMWPGRGQHYYNTWSSMFLFFVPLGVNAITRGLNLNFENMRYVSGSFFSGNNTIRIITILA